MDRDNLTKLLMTRIKDILAIKYNIKFEEKDIIDFTVDEQGAIINFSDSSVNIQDLRHQTVIHYEFWKYLGAIGIYIKFKKCDDGSLNIIHGRCIKENKNGLAVMVSGCKINNFSGNLNSDSIINWPQYYFGTTIEDTLKLMNKFGFFSINMIDPEFAVDLQPEQVIDSIDELTNQCEQKLDVNPTR